MFRIFMPVCLIKSNHYSFCGYISSLHPIKTSLVPRKLYSFLDWYILFSVPTVFALSMYSNNSFQHFLPDDTPQEKSFPIFSPSNNISKFCVRVMWKKLHKNNSASIKLTQVKMNLELTQTVQFVQLLLSKKD